MNVETAIEALDYLARCVGEHMEVPPPEARCHNCRFFDPIDGMEGLLGHCRVASPAIDMMPVYEDDDGIEQGFSGDPDMGVATLMSVSQTDVTRRGVWPQVGSNDWCGEWRRPASTVVETRPAEETT